ncbi:MAG TPA: universal stress protein [Candidatus Manganitrophaceae bacterium]|nr:universal stress protein [Candidatus Manganitrophaceae bacterium]
MAKFQHILVATDFSACAEEALRQAVDLAQGLQGKITLLHVFESPFPYPDAPSLSAYPQLYRSLQDFKREEEKKLQSIAGTVGTAIGIRPLFKEGSPSLEIVKAARELKADLIVVGTHGRAGMSRFLMGSVAQKVSQIASCPVLIVREKSDEASEEAAGEATKEPG